MFTFKEEDLAGPWNQGPCNIYVYVSCSITNYQMSGPGGPGGSMEPGVDVYVLCAIVNYKLCAKANPVARET